MKKGFTTFLSALKANTPPCKKGLSSLRRTTLFFLLLFAISNIWGEDYLINVESTNLSNDSKWYEVESVGGVTNKTGSTWSNADYECTPTGAKTGSSNFTIRTDKDNTTEIKVNVSSKSNRTISSVKTSTSLSSFSEATNCTPNGTVTKQICDQVLTFTFNPAINAGTYVNITVSGNLNVHAVTITTTSASTQECPSGLTISGENEYLEGETIKLTAALTAGNGDITYNWYKGADLTTAKAAGSLGTGLTFTKASCTTADADNYFCVASKTDCDDVESSSFAVTVAEDSRCFVMPAITSTPSNIGSISVTGGTLADVGDGKTLKMQNTGIGFGNGNAARLKVTLTSSSIVEGTKITIDYNNASNDGSGVGLYNENYEHQVIDETGVTGSGSFSHTFTAEEAANYADVFLIDRNNTGKGMIIGSITVENCGPAIVKHTITLDYNDGATTNSSILVVDETTATQPADPERGKYTFLGWYNGETLYDWATPVTSNLILTAKWQDPWTITFDSNGGSTVETITVKHNTVAEQPEDPTLADHDFNGWFYGDPAVAFDWTAAVTQNYALTAQWQAAVAKYDVQYYDGETLLGTELQVRVDQHPTAEDIETNKPLYTFVGWFTSSTLEGDPVALNTVTPIEGLKLYGKWAKAFATSYDMEEYAASAGADKDGLESELTAAGYAFTNVNGIDNDHTHNYIYDGMKYKTNDGDLSFNVNAGKLVIVKTGNLPADALTMYINGVADPTVFVGANEDVETHVNNYFYSEVEALYRLDIQASKGTCAIKAVTITDPFTVSFDANGGDDVASLNGTPFVTLPGATKGTESFKGWFDAATGGNKIGDAGEEYTPTKNITLYAQWEAISTDARLASITFSSDAGTLSPAFDPEVTNYTYTMPYGTAAVPTITGATKANAAAKDPVIDAQATAWGETAHVHGVAASNDTKDYYVQMLRAPKDGTCIVKADLAAGSSAASITATSGAYKDADNIAINVAKDLKLGGTGTYVKVAVKDTYFQDGDVVEIVLRTDKSASAWLQIFADEGTTLVAEMKSGVSNATPNHLTISGVPENTSALYLYRTEAADGDMNPYPTSMAVYRAMNPILKAITINGEAGTINESAKTVAVELQPGYDLAALTIVPTIVSNTAEADVVKTVESNGGAWVIGDNTYRLTDKDGDYTDYTITLSVGVLKHTVSFNTHGGSTIDDVEVEDGQKLAAAPADPTKEDYLFQGWAETEDGSIVDVTSFTISTDKEFHAIWAPDGAIKLLDGATVNHTNYITSVTADETVEFKGNEVHYAKFTGTVSGVNGVKDLTRVIAYNATTNKTKIQISAHNNSTNARNILVKGLVEGASEVVDLATIALGNKEDKISDWIEFNNAANRTIYIFVPSSAGDVYFTQVKVIESGETQMKMAGEAGYSLNFNKGRFFGVKNVTAHFEGLDVEVASSDCAPLNTEVVKLANTSISFVVASPVTLTVTTKNGNTYYVTKGSAGTDNETAKAGASDFNLTAGSWYITGGASNVEITKIAFTAPKCEQPTVVDMENISLCEGDAFTALTVSASVTDGGTLHYQWYKHPDAGDDEAVGTDAASYTPAADGQYYVIVTNKLADHSDNSKASNMVTVEHFASAEILSAPENVRMDAGETATLAVVATGKNVTYQWYKCEADGTNAMEIVGATAASYEVTVGTGVQYYKVVVSSDCGTPVEAVVKVEEWTELPLADVTESIIWDFSKAGTTTLENQNDVVLANVVGIVNNANFNSQALKGSFNKLPGNYFQGSQLSFTADKDGLIIITFRGTNNNNRILKVYDNADNELASWTYTGSGDAAEQTQSVEVPAGKVTLKAFQEENSQNVRIYELQYLALGHRREASWIAPRELGTVCLKDECIIKGAELYELQGPDANRKLVFDEILSGELEAGKPYLFNATATGRISFYNKVNAAHTETAGSLKGMYGTFEDLTFSPATDQNIYYFSGHNIWAVKKNTADVLLPAYLCYVKMDELLASPVPDANPAPGRRRVTLGVNGQNVTTGVENVDASTQPTKVLINGQLFILRGEKIYDATGKLVK